MTCDTKESLILGGGAVVIAVLAFPVGLFAFRLVSWLSTWADRLANYLFGVML